MAKYDPAGRDDQHGVYSEQDDLLRRDRERRRDLERRRLRRPVRIPADGIYELIERISRRDSVIARTDVRACALCGRALSRENMTVDHTIARGLGGPDSPENLQATCFRCNNLKSRLEASVHTKMEVGAAPAGVVTDVLKAIRNADERARFAGHPSVAALLHALSA